MKTFPTLWRKFLSLFTTLSTTQQSVSTFISDLKDVEKWPFETHQTGWGEFEIGVRIHFKDPYEKPVDCIHMLKLYTDNQNQSSTVKKPVVSERYDEVVFKNPTEAFYEILKAGPKPKSPKE